MATNREIASADSESGTTPTGPAQIDQRRRVRDRDQRGDMQLSFVIDGGRETDAPARGWNDEAARHNRVADAALTDHLGRLDR
jgi:hypothetical protein